MKRRLVLEMLEDRMALSSVSPIAGAPVPPSNTVPLPPPPIYIPPPIVPGTDNPTGK